MRRQRQRVGRGRAVALVLVMSVTSSGMVTSVAGATTPSPTDGAVSTTTTAILPDTTPAGAAAFEGPVHTVQVGAITFGYRQFGAGRPVVLVMGTNGWLAFWQWQLMSKLVSAGFQVTEFDNQGIGYSSDTPNVPLTVQGMARNDVGFIKALGLKRPTVIGWSMGGEIVITMAALFGDDVGTVISSGGDAGSSHYVKGSAKNLNVFFHGSLGDIAQLVFSPPGPRSQAALTAWAESAALFPLQVPSAEIQARQSASFTRFQRSDQVWNKLPTIRNKVIVTNGSEDVLNPAVNAKIIAARIPGARAIVFPEAGHAMMFQDMDRFVATVTRYAGR